MNHIPATLGHIPEAVHPRPRPGFVIGDGSRSWRREMRALLDYGELLYFLVWRDVKIRYKQTFFGAGWAILQPLVTMLIFTVVFGKLVNVPSDGIPYPLFAYTGLLAWNYFASAVAKSGNSLVANGNLITKVYFPRVIIPLSAIISPLVDLAVASLLLVAMMLWFRIVPTAALLALPVFVLLCMLTALSVSLWLSALCVRYRDVGVAIPFMVQIWMYASPIVYPGSLVPEKWRMLYGLNPMAGVIDGFRWAFLGTAPPSLTTLTISTVGIVLISLGGLMYFSRMERVFADVV